MIDETNFLEIAQSFNAEDGKDVYFYTFSNKDIHVRKTIVEDFNSWVAVYNHYDNDTTVLIAGAPPINNNDRYTLLKHLENVVPTAPVEEAAIVEDITTEIEEEAIVEDITTAIEEEAIVEDITMEIEEEAIVEDITTAIESEIISEVSTVVTSSALS